MRLRRDQAAGAALVALAAAIAWENRVLPFGTAHEPGPGYAPFILALLLAAFGVVVVIAGRRSPPLAELSWGERRHAVAILGSCVFAALALEWLGYRITTLAIMAFLLGVVERRSLATIVLVSLLLSLGSFWLFADFLKVPLPRGPWDF